MLTPPSAIARCTLTNNEFDSQRIARCEMMNQFCYMRFLLLLLISLYHLGSLYSQPLEGTYRYTSPGGDQAAKLTFSTNYRFEHVTFSDMSNSLGYGYYVVSGDSLVLFYDEAVVADTSYCEVEQKTLGKVSQPTIPTMVVNLTIINAESKQPVAAWIYLDDSEGSIQLAADSLGNAEFVVWNKLVFENIRILFPGYDSVEISADSLMGSSNRIRCYLRVPEYTPIVHQRQCYTIVERSKQVLMLDNGSYQQRWEKVSDNKDE